MADSDAVSAGLNRQRRSLMIVSLALLFYESAGLVVEQINVLGNTVKVQNPEKATLLLWGAWGYFLLRYYQYFRDLPEKGFGSAYRVRFDELATAMAVRRFAKKYEPDPDSPGTARGLKVTPIDARIMHSSHDDWEAEIDYEVHYRRDGVARATQRPTGQKAVLFRPELRMARVRAVLYVLLSTRLATEYVLPFVVALAAPAYVAASWLIDVR